MKLAGRLQHFITRWEKLTGVCKGCKNRIPKWFRTHSNLLSHS